MESAIKITPLLNTESGDETSGNDTEAGRQLRVTSPTVVNLLLVVSRTTISLLSTWQCWILLLLALVFIQDLRHVLRRQALRRKEAALGCQAPRQIPHSWPFGLNHCYTLFKGYRENHMAQVFERFFEIGGNTFEINLLGKRVLATHEAANVEAIFRTNIESFTTAGRLELLHILLPSSVITQEGPSWKHTRSLMRTPLSRPQYHDLDMVRRHADNFIALLPENEPVNLSPLFLRFSTDTGSSLLFGKSVNSLVVPRVPAEEQFEKAFEYCWQHIARRGRCGPFISLLPETKFREERALLYGYIENIIYEASTRSRIVESESHFIKRGRTPLLDSFLQGKDDRNEIRDHMIFCFAAAKWTTSALLTWTLRLLARHPDVLDRLRDEISTVLGDDVAIKSLTRDDIKKLPYLDCVLKEVLRLYPLTHALAYPASRDVTLPVGGGPDGTCPTLVQAGEAVNVCLWTMQRRKDIWGEDANDFIPERWEGDRPLPNMWSYVPFGRGPRSCPGQDFALTEASYLIIRLLQEFSTIRVARTDPMPGMSGADERFRMGFVIESADGCLIEFER